MRSFSLASPVPLPPSVTPGRARALAAAAIARLSRSSATAALSQCIPVLSE